MSIAWKLLGDRRPTPGPSPSSPAFTPSSPAFNSNYNGPFPGEKSSDKTPLIVGISLACCGVLCCVIGIVARRYQATATIK
jgi:hypothetical protein